MTGRSPIVRAAGATRGMANSRRHGISEAETAMFSDFEDFNAYVYHSLRALVFDVVIWCLGPYVDDTQTYGWVRLHLAHVTCSIVRRVIGAR
jgi:hypothetical protein